MKKFNGAILFIGLDPAPWCEVINSAFEVCSCLPGIITVMVETEDDARLELEKILRLLKEEKDGVKNGNKESSR